MFDDFDTQIQSDELVCEGYDESEAPASIKHYYEVPTQVKVIDVNSEDEGEYCYFGGIAYRNEIICGCCGGIFEIDDLYEEAHDLRIDPDDVIIPYPTWVDISEEIKGD